MEIWVHDQIYSYACASLRVFQIGSFRIVQGKVWAGNLLRNLFLDRTVDSVNYNLNVFLEIIIFDSWYRNDFRVVYM